MKTLNILLAGILTSFLFIGCSSSNSDVTVSNNIDPQLVGKWIRRNKYHLELYSNGIGSKEKDITVTEDVKKFRKSRINWATFNNNFLLINMDKEVMGFSYQVKGDTLFLREPKDSLEYFLKVKDDKKEK